ncbi:MAG: S8 family serine peptidase [Anaerolineae bacterium]
MPARGSIPAPRVEQPAAMVPGVLLVGLEPGAAFLDRGGTALAGEPALNALLEQAGLQAAEPLFPSTAGLASGYGQGAVALDRIYRLRLAPDADVLDLAADLAALPGVAFAEPDYLAHTVATPDDPFFPRQWGLAQIEAPAAWDVVTGSPDVVVAVVDAGLDTAHPDLAGRLWVNPGEIPGNGLDDDNNGHVDDVHGWNLVDDDANLADNTGHGTQVAGVIAAETDNGQGVAGVCWHCRLMIVKVTQPGGVANYSDIAAGVVYAAEKGAEVINLSLGGYGDSATLRAAVAAASQAAVIVGGAGNDDGEALFYPAAYDDDVLAAAGTTAGDAKTGSSNYGTWVDISAPGEVISTTFDAGGYGTTSGTSMAAPFVSGLAGLLRSQHPAWSPQLVRAQILHTALDIDGLNPGYEGKLGRGRIDAAQAVITAPQPQLSYLAHAVDGQPEGRPEPGSTVNLEVTLHNDWAEASNVQAALSSSDPYVTILSGTADYGNVGTYDDVAGQPSFRFSVSGSAPYAHDMAFSLHVTADGGYALDIPLTIPTSAGIVHIHGALTSQTWTDDHVYVVDGDAGIVPGEVLQIEPGTVVRFDGPYSLIIEGTLLADGEAGQPITFTSNRTPPAPGDWQRLIFTDSSIDATFDAQGNYVSGSIVRHAVFEYGDSAVYMDDAGPYFAHNLVRHVASASAGIGGGSNNDSSAWPVIAHNTLLNTGIIVYLNVSGATVVGNTLTGAGMRLNGSHMGAVDDNSVSDAPYDPGIVADNPASVSGNRVVNCYQGIGAGGDGLISGNLVANSKTVGLGTSGTTTVISNTILNSGQTGIMIGIGSPTLHHNNVIVAPGGYALYNDNTNAVDATGNWWGTADGGEIEDLIYDGSDQYGLGLVDHDGYLLAPDPSAPAYLAGLALDPPSPVGIETVTFSLDFSRPMDPGRDPLVVLALQPVGGAGSSDSDIPSLPQGNGDYLVSDNAAWLDAFHWQATFDVTSLIPRGTYTVTVGGAWGTDALEMAEDTRFQVTVDYAGEITDQTPPPPPSVLAGGVEGDASAVEAHWSAHDPESAITGYRYALGSAGGDTDIVAWTPTTGTSLSRSGLGLVEGQQYWLTVQARNVGGLWSDGGQSSFVAGRPPARIHLPLILKD